MSSKITCRDLKCSCSSVCVFVGEGGGRRGNGEEEGKGLGGKEESLKIQIVILIIKHILVALTSLFVQGLSYKFNFATIELVNPCSLATE